MPEGGHGVRQPTVSQARAEEARRRAGTANQTATAQAQLQEAQHHTRLATIEVPRHLQRKLPAECHGFEPGFQAQLDEALYHTGVTTPASLLPRRGIPGTAQATDRATVSQAPLDQPRNTTGDQPNNARQGEAGAPVEPTRQSSAMGGGPFGNGISGGWIQWD